MGEINSTMSSVAELSNSINMQTSNSVEELSTIEDQIITLNKMNEVNSRELIDLKEEAYMFK
jgi:hypothetical protein